MENPSETSLIAFVLVYLSSLNTFQLLFNVISSSLLSSWALLRCLFLFSEDSDVKFEPKSASSEEQGKKQGARLDEETEDGCFLLGREVNMVMKRLGMDKYGFLVGDDVQKRWGCNEICAVFEEEVRAEEVKEAFEVFDQDNDGFIDAEELQRVLLALGLRQGEELKACRKMIGVFDDDGDGKIDFHEFVKLFHIE